MAELPSLLIYSIPPENSWLPFKREGLKKTSKMKCIRLTNRWIKVKIDIIVIQMPNIVQIQTLGYGENAAVI